MGSDWKKQNMSINNHVLSCVCHVELCGIYSQDAWISLNYMPCFAQRYIAAYTNCINTDFTQIPLQDIWPQHFEWLRTWKSKMLGALHINSDKMAEHTNVKVCGAEVENFTRGLPSPIGLPFSYFPPGPCLHRNGLFGPGSSTSSHEKWVTLEWLSDSGDSWAPKSNSSAIPIALHVSLIRSIPSDCDGFNQASQPTWPIEMLSPISRRWVALAQAWQGLFHEDSFSFFLGTGRNWEAGSFSFNSIVMTAMMNHLKLWVKSLFVSRTLLTSCVPNRKGNPGSRKQN